MTVSDDVLPKSIRLRSNVVSVWNSLLQTEVKHGDSVIKVDQLSFDLSPNKSFDVN